MEFVLTYQGELKPAGTPSDKHRIRGVFHPQLRELWKQRPLNLISPEEFKPKLLHGWQFQPLVRHEKDLVANLEITMIRPDPPGSILTQGGDIDNKIKTLLDALRMPRVSNEIPKNVVPRDEESPFHCLLEDDSLVVSLKVSTERWLVPDERKSTEVLLIIRVLITQLRTTWDKPKFVWAKYTGS